jgi:hypothetical protein
MDTDEEKFNPEEARKIVGIAADIFVKLFEEFKGEPENLLVCYALVHQKIIEFLPSDPHFPTYHSILDFHKELVADGIEFRLAKKRERSKLQ